MLLRFGVKNHLSLASEEALVLTQSALRDPAAGLIKSLAYTQAGLLPAAIIYGANASGKSNVISAMNLMQNHVLSSHSRGTPGGKVPRQPFALNKRARDVPSKFEIDFILDELRYNFGYETDGDAFTSEWLYSFPMGRRTRLYERHGQEFSFGRSMRGQNKIIEGLTRTNSLFISAAAQNDHEVALRIYAYVKSIIFANHISIGGMVASSLLKEGEIDDRVIAFLERIGTGVIGYKKHHIDPPPEMKVFQAGLKDLFRKSFDNKEDNFDPIDFVRVSIQLGHRTDNESTEYFELENESSGTRRLLVILGSVFAALDNGVTIIIDELDASLHTLAAEAIIALFCNKNTNPKGAQLIATVHDTNILSCDFLRRDQIWLISKDKVGCSHLFPLSDVKIRKGDNIEKGYLQGRYGAVPFSTSISDLISDL